jgi:N utilization substance protein A
MLKELSFKKFVKLINLKQYEEYKDKVGEIAVGIVKRVEFGNYIVDLVKVKQLSKEKN